MRSALTLILTTLVASSAQAGGYPTIAQVESELKMHPGQMFPKLVQGPDGTIYKAIYIRGKARLGGFYDATIKLEPFVVQSQH